MTGIDDHLTNPTEGAPLAEPLAFLAELDRRSVHYSLAVVRPGSLMVEIAVPGEHWEVEFMVDGFVEVERFRSDGTIGDRSMLADLWVAAGDRPDFPRTVCAHERRY